MLPDTAERVPQHTAAHVNARIEDDIEASVAYFARHPEAIDARLAELDREWDIERTLEANAAAVSLLGAGAGGDRGPQVAGSFPRRSPAS